MDRRRSSRTLRKMGRQRINDLKRSRFAHRVSSPSPAFNGLTTFTLNPPQLTDRPDLQDLPVTPFDGPAVTNQRLDLFVRPFPSSASLPAIYGRRRHARSVESLDSCNPLFAQTSTPWHRSGSGLNNSSSKAELPAAAGQPTRLRDPQLARVSIGWAFARPATLPRSPSSPREKQTPRPSRRSRIPSVLVWPLKLPTSHWNYARPLHRLICSSNDKTRRLGHRNVPTRKMASAVFGRLNYHICFRPHCSSTSIQSTCEGSEPLSSFDSSQFNLAIETCCYADSPSLGRHVDPNVPPEPWPPPIKRASLLLLDRSNVQLRRIEGEAARSYDPLAATRHCFYPKAFISIGVGPLCFQPETTGVALGHLSLISSYGAICFAVSTKETVLSLIHAVACSVFVGPS